MDLNFQAISFLNSSSLIFQGSECEYRHCLDTLTNKETCREWTLGKCFNYNCAFRHPSTKAIPCSFFIRGSCTKGSSCPYLHPIVSPEIFSELKKKEEEIR